MSHAEDYSLNSKVPGDNEGLSIEICFESVPILGLYLGDILVQLLVSLKLYSVTFRISLYQFYVSLN